MISAKEAREQAIKVIVDKEMEDIEICIKKAVSLGKTEIYYHKYINTATIAKLENLGYTVELLVNNSVYRDDTKQETKISW